MMNTTSDNREAELRRDSAYGYTCSACGRCCNRYIIRVNPYEVLSLAQHLGLSASDFLQKYVTPETALIHKQDDSCIFLGPEGCAVHPARPLVCRLYPLGRHLSGNGDEWFFRMVPLPDSEGVYGDAGSVADYLAAQGALPYMVAADRYMAVFRRYWDALGTIPKEELLSGEDSGEREGYPQAIPELLNPDSVVAKLIETGNGTKTDPEIVMQHHIEALEVWLTQFHQKGE
jgi:Fe-S-cluster containining protein